MTEQTMTVHQVADLTGLTPRTLHYYDEIGLLKPAMVTDARYRLYTRADLSRLQEILFFREVGFPLKEIKRLLDSPHYSRTEALEKHLVLLEAQRQRLGELAALVKEELSGASSPQFAAFSNEKVESLQAEYRREALERWGDTDSYKACEAALSKKSVKQQNDQMAAFETAAQRIFEKLALYEEQPPTHPEVQRLVREWQQYISKNFYPCNAQMLTYLADLYVADERFAAFINRFGHGNLAAFFAQAINVYCQSAE